jgi:hypothetical protein
MRSIRFPAIVLCTLCSVHAAPAFAEGGTRIPEPSSLALFALGVLGVIVGRQASRRRGGD